MIDIQVTLMCKNISVAELTGTLDKSGLPIFTASSVHITNPSLVPISIIQDEKVVDRFNIWFKKRYFSDKRHFPVEQIEWFHPGQPHFCSLSDQYWIKYDVSERWEKVNFFTNSYSETFGDISFSYNMDEIKNITISFESPDLTTNGILDKRWKRITKKGQEIDILIKRSSKYYKQDILSEIMASRYLEKMQLIPFVKYSLFIDGYAFSCMCPNFVDEDTAFVPAWEIVSAIPKEKDVPIYTHLIRCVEQFKIPNALEFIDNMIIVDRMMLNFDRHLGNFGFLRNSNTGEFIGPAPIFDFGDAFFPKDENIEQVSKLFFDREKELLNLKKIPLLDFSVIESDIAETFFLLPEEKTKLLSDIQKNNRYILSFQKNHKQKEKKANEKEADIQIANVFF